MIINISHNDSGGYDSPIWYQNFIKHYYKEFTYPVNLFNWLVFYNKKLPAGIRMLEWGISHDVIQYTHEEDYIAFILEWS